MAGAVRLSANSASGLEERGFVVLPGPVPFEGMPRLAAAYDAVMGSATEPDLRVGSTTTRVVDLVNRGAEFDVLYVFPPLLDACARIIGRPFKLSSLLARTLRPRAPAQEIHVDVQSDSADWPLVGFILMIDEFRSDNGATQFISGDDRALALGPAGSLLIFNGSVVHGHTANVTDRPRRSIHGSFIPREGKSATDFAARMTPETRARLSPVAQQVLGL